MRVLAACHSGIDACHYGNDKTLSKVRLCDFILASYMIQE